MPGLPLSGARFVPIRTGVARRRRTCHVHHAKGPIGRRRCRPPVPRPPACERRHLVLQVRGQRARWRRELLQLPVRNILYPDRTRRVLLPAFRHDCPRELQHGVRTRRAPLQLRCRQPYVLRDDATTSSRHWHTDAITNRWRRPGAPSITMAVPRFVTSCWSASTDFTRQTSTTSSLRTQSLRSPSSRSVGSSTQMRTRLPLPTRSPAWPRW
jgi:hypothetical protein